MKNKFNAVTRFLPAALATLFLMTGCHTTTKLQLYTGPDVPADQLTTLVVPWCISLRTVDGAPAPSTMADEMRLVLGPGPHTLEARYVVIYPTRDSESEKIVSDYVLLRFNGEAGKTYTICSKDPKTLEETRRYASHVTLWIEGSGKATVITPPAQPVATVTAPNTSSDKTTTPDPNVQSQLQKVWEKASEQDRKAFLEKNRQP